VSFFQQPWFVPSLTACAALVFAGMLPFRAKGADSEEGKQAPDEYVVKFATTKGDVLIEVHRDWAPLGADRFHELVTAGFYDGCRFFRVVPDFVVQFGMNGDPKVHAEWEKKRLKDDKVTQTNKRGYLTFATSGPNSRTTQLFINLKDNAFLDRSGFSPFAQVISGMDHVDDINPEYGERPDQGMITRQGNEYLEKSFPKLDYIKKATIVELEKKEK
jgi:peptidyl-prolyl cis-trans isomerase A (cyclophilin A)